MSKNGHSTKTQFVFVKMKEKTLETIKEINDQFECPDNYFKVPDGIILGTKKNKNISLI